MEKENKARVSPGDESRVSFVRKRVNSRSDSSSLPLPTFYLRMPRMRRHKLRLSPIRFNDRLPTIADNRFSISFLTYRPTSRSMLTHSSYDRLHDARLELKFDRTSEEQRRSFLFIDLFERCNDLCRIYTCNKFVCESFI